MSTTLEGDTLELHRVITPFWSFNQAFADQYGMGFPVRAICELYGPTGVGKSTVILSISARIAQELGRNISLAAFEPIDPRFVTTVLDNAGYSGILRVELGESDEAVFDNQMDSLRKKDYVIGIVDSLEAISPIAEIDGKSGDAVMGKRARLTAQHCRRALHTFRMKQSPNLLFLATHIHANIGRVGITTTGGETKSNLAVTRVHLTRKKEYEDGSALLGGKVDKNRFGPSKRSFCLFNLGGWGIHPGLTAVMDCVFAGIAKDDRTIKLGDKKYGYFSKMIEQYADDELFQPFLDALKEQGSGPIYTGDDESEDD